MDEQKQNDQPIYGNSEIEPTSKICPNVLLWIWANIEAA